MASVCDFLNVIFIIVSNLVSFSLKTISSRTSRRNEIARTWFAMSRSSEVMSGVRSSDRLLMGWTTKKPKKKANRVWVLVWFSRTKNETDEKKNMKKGFNNRNEC